MKEQAPSPGAVDAAGRESIELAWQLAERIRQRYADKAADVGLSAGQAKVLKNLDTVRPVSMRVIARVSHLDPSNLTAVVDKLEARGLVERRDSPKDRRSKELVLTSAGQETVAALRRALEADLGPLEGLAPERLLLLRDLLREVNPGREGA
jgi:DNA-binding MarR family transcriptional regulator